MSIFIQPSVGAASVTPKTNELMTGIITQFYDSGRLETRAIYIDDNDDGPIKMENYLKR